MKVMIVRGRTAGLAIAALLLATVLACLLGVLPESIQAAASTKYRLIRSVDTEEKVIAITLDGRENDWYLEEFSGYLQRYDVTASFFITGSYAKEYSRSLDKLHAAGYSIQSLGSRGKDLSKMTIAELTADLEDAAEQIRKYTWKEPTIVRCMEGEMNRDCISAALSKGFSIISASVDSEAFPGLEGTSLGDKMLENIAPGAIVRFRLDVSGDAAALDRFLAGAIERGYRVVAIEDLLLSEPYTVDGDGVQRVE